MENNKMPAADSVSSTAVRSGAVEVQNDWKLVPVEATWEMTRPAFSFDVWRVRCDCGQEYSGGLSHNKAAQLFKSMAAAAPASARAAAPVAASEPTDLTAAQIFDIATPYFAWTKDGKECGDWQIATQGVIGMPALLEYTKKVLSARAADAPSEPIEALENIFESWDGCKYDDIDIGAALRADFNKFIFGKSRAADALDSQPTAYATMYRALEKIAAPATDSCGCDFPCQCETEAAEELNAEGMRSRARVALDMVDAAKVASSQPTDGEVRNG